MSHSLSAGLCAGALTVGVGLAASPADAAPTVSTRVAGYSVSPTTITKGASITVKGAAQKLSGSRWLAAPGTSALVYFDADGPTANTFQRTLAASKSGAFSGTFKPAVSGYWTVTLKATATNKTSSTTRIYVRVNTPATKSVITMPKGSINCPSYAPLKGNESSHIFHAPGQRYYARTKPEFCFATKAAAIAAGYRAAKV